jgi:flagellar motor switch protein FliG
MAESETGLDTAQDAAQDAPESARERRLDPAEAAAVFVMLLGEEEAAELLARLNPQELQKVGEAMCEIGEIGPPRIAEAIAGFVAEAEVERIGSREPAAQLSGLLTRAVGEVKTANLMQRIAPDAAPRSVEIARWLEPETLAPLIEEEHPQVIAVLLLMIETESAAKVLTMLPAELQSAVVERVARLGKVSGDAVEMLDQLLSSRISGQFGSTVLEMGGARDAANLINLAGQDVSELVMPEIEARDAALSKKIEDEMFTFEMLFVLDAKDMGRLLRDVDNGDLVNALKGIKEDEQAYFFAAMSSRAADGIRDEIDLLPKLKKSDVETAQRNIVEIARKLRDDGEISLGGDDGDFV